jgi:hypothetical protein
LTPNGRAGWVLARLGLQLVSTRFVLGTADRPQEGWLVCMSSRTHAQGLAARVVGIYAAPCSIWTTTPPDTNKAT